MTVSSSLRALLSALPLLLAGCWTTGSLRDGRSESSEVAYRLGEPGPGWERLALNQANVAWHNPALEASILVNSHCEGVADSPL